MDYKEFKFLFEDRINFKNFKNYESQILEYFKPDEIKSISVSDLSILYDVSEIKDKIVDYLNENDDFTPADELENLYEGFSFDNVQLNKEDIAQFEQFYNKLQDASIKYIDFSEGRFYFPYFTLKDEIITLDDITKQLEGISFVASTKHPVNPYIYKESYDDENYARDVLDYDEEYFETSGTCGEVGITAKDIVDCGFIKRPEYIFVELLNKLNIENYTSVSSNVEKIIEGDKKAFLLHCQNKPKTFFEFANHYGFNFQIDNGKITGITNEYFKTIFEPDCLEILNIEEPQNIDL